MGHKSKGQTMSHATSQIAVNACAATA